MFAVIRVISAIFLKVARHGSAYQHVRKHVGHMFASAQYRLPLRIPAIQDTLDAAHSDAENMVAENLAKKAEYVKKLESFFKAIDECGDGMITEERLTKILDNPKVAAYFATLDVDV